jgi:hypothetical protein
MIVDGRRRYVDQNVIPFVISWVSMGEFCDTDLPSRVS